MSRSNPERDLSVILFGFTLGCLLFLMLACAPRPPANDSRTSDLQLVPNPAAVDRASYSILKDYDLSSREGLLLEVVSERNGMTIPNGRLISIRLLKNGDFEFDSVNQENSTNRRYSKLANDEVNQIKSLLFSTAFDGLSSEYHSKEICLDSSFVREIIYIDRSGKSRRIRVVECGITGKESGEDIPEILTELINRIDKIGKLS